MRGWVIRASFVGVVGIMTIDVAVVQLDTCAPESKPLRLATTEENSIFRSYRAEK